MLLSAINFLVKFRKPLQPALASKQQNRSTKLFNTCRIFRLGLVISFATIPKNFFQDRIPEPEEWPVVEAEDTALKPAPQPAEISTPPVRSTTTSTSPTTSPTPSTKAPTPPSIQDRPKLLKRIDQEPRFVTLLK